ncbi:MAG: 30S ribosomal protein S5 [bacterium]|nr:30S ribosomal protein S5 [bacterium]
MKKPNDRRKTFVKREPKEFDEQVIQIDRVTRVVKGGRKLRFRATVAIGNKKGKVGIGIGKSQEVTGAIQKGIAKAKRDLVQVNLDENTIPHQIKIKYKAAKILLLPAVPGTGLIAGGTIRKVLELAGIKDILSKSYGTTNKVNCTKATFEALKRLVPNPAMLKKAKKKAEAKAKTPETKEPEAKAPKEPKTAESKAKAPKEVQPTT